MVPGFGLAKGRCRGPQHDRAADQLGLEPVAALQPELPAQAGRQRPPAVMVELERRHGACLSGMLRVKFAATVPLCRGHAVIDAAVQAIAKRQVSEFLAK